jgi:hypothetical protein
VAFGLGILAGAVVGGPALAGAATKTTTTSSPATSTSAPTATSAKVSSAIKAAGQQTSVHYVASSRESGRSITITSSSSATAGTQKIVLRASKSVGHVSGRLVNKIVYFRGDTFGLEEYLGMPATLAPKYTGKWIFFSPATKDYAPIAKSFTLATAISQIAMKGPFTSKSGTVDGKSATTVTGRDTVTGHLGKAGSATLSIASSGTPLPIHYSGKTTVNKTKISGTVDYSAWGQKVTPKAPQGAVAASSITSSG